MGLRRVRGDRHSRGPRFLPAVLHASPRRACRGAGCGGAGYRTVEQEGEDLMPRLSEQGPSNAPRPEQLAALETFHGGAPSPGTSSLTSDDKPELSGSRLQATELSNPLPAQDAASPSKPDQQADQAPSDTVSSTDGSTPGTGQGQPRRSASSAASRRRKAVTPDTTEESDEDE